MLFLGLRPSGNAKRSMCIFTMLEENLAVPFMTKLLGVEVTVERADLNDAGEIVAVCRGMTRIEPFRLDQNDNLAHPQFFSGLRRSESQDNSLGHQEAVISPGMRREETPRPLRRMRRSFPLPEKYPADAAGANRPDFRA